MNIPEFPWDPKDEDEQEQLHALFHDAQKACMQAEYRHCNKCNLKRLRNPLKGLEVYPNCSGKKKIVYLSS